MGSSPAPAHFASSGPRAERTPSRLTFPRRSSRFIRRLTPPGSTPIFPPPGGASWPFSGLPAGAKRPLQTSAASPKDWSTVWKPPSVPAPPTTNFWTLSPPSATPGRGMRRLAMDAALGCTADSLPALPPYLHLLGGKKDALPLLKNCTLPVSHSLARLRGSGSASARMAEAQLAAADFGTLCRVSPEAMGGLLRQKNIFLT